MKRRTLWKVVIAITIVLCGTLGTARARLAWSDSQEQAKVDRARATTSTTIDRARSDGLSRQVLVPFVRRFDQLAGQQPPTSLSTWIAGTSSFYRAQVSHYQAVAADVDAALARATALTRSRASRALATGKTLIAAAQSLDVDTAAAETAVRQQTRDFQRDSILRQYAGIVAALRAPATALNTAVASRKENVAQILAHAHNSQAGVIQLADADVQSVQARLSLLGLLTSRASTYGVRLGALDRSVHLARTPTGSAVKELELHQEVAAVASDYARTIPDKMVVVSTERQWATMYEKGNEVFDTPVTTGGPELPTDHGVFHIYMKVSPFVFHSPWPPSSPYYYPPTPITYWMPFDGGEGLHDASWRSNFGPGSNFAPTNLGTGNYILGTHGCVNLPFNAAQFVWNWAPVGTTVVVV